MRMIKIYVLLCFLLAVFSGCDNNKLAIPEGVPVEEGVSVEEDIPVGGNGDLNGVKTETQDPVSQENEPAPEEYEPEQYEREENPLGAVLRDIGRTPSQITDITDLVFLIEFEYFLQQDHLIIGDEEQNRYHMFSDGVELEDSVCIAIGTGIYDLLPKDHEKIVSVNDLPSDWQASEIPSPDAGYREYRFGENIVVIYLDESGNFFRDKVNVVIKTAASADVRLYDFLEVANEPPMMSFSLAGEYGERMRKYAECIGRPLYEIDAGMRFVEEGMFGNPIYEADGIQYQTGADDTCGTIFAPAGRIFGTQDDIDADYLKSRVKVDFSWGDGEYGCFYMYKFGDIHVYIDSDSKGIIAPDERVMIKER